MDPAAAHARSFVARARRPTRNLRPDLHPDRFLSPPGGAAVHILRLATAVLFHNFWSFPFNGDAWNQNFWPFLKNFGLAGGFLYIAADAKMQSLRDAFSLNPR
jgi:hypothetical protein